MPATLERVENLKDDTNPGGAVGVLTIEYSSNNKKVAVVDENGTITAVGKGKAKITAKITLYSGKTKTVKKRISVE